MSRIHDALRRGDGPASKAAVKRTAEADAVLAALGYPSDEPSRRPRARLPAVAGLLVSVGLLTASLLIPRSEFLAFVETRGTPVPPPSGATPVPPPSAAAPVKVERNDPRPPVPDARTPKATAPALPATKTPVAPAPAVSEPAKKPVPPAAPPRTSPADARPLRAAPDEFQLALYYQRAGDFEQALMHYRAALQRNEMHVEAHNNLGNLYLGKGLFEEAAREFQRVIAIDPKYLNAHVNLSAAYTRLGRPDAAAAEARAALQIDGRNPDAMVNLALAQHDAGLIADAQRSLRLALEIDPRNAAAHYNIARQFEAAGEVSSAIAHYNQFILYASPEQTAFVADVRMRVTALTARLK